MGNSEKSIVKPTIQITVLSFIGIILSFVTQLVLAYFFGTTPERDAYFAAVVLPTYLTSILAGSIGIIFLPMYVDIKTKNSLQKANIFFSQTLVLSIIISLVIIAVCSIFADRILLLTTPGFYGEQLSLTSHLLIILLPTILFQIVLNIVGSILQVQHRFILPALNPIFTAIISLLFVMAFSRFWGIKSLAYGMLVGNLIVAVLLLIYVRKSLFLKLIDSFKNSGISTLLKVSAPLLLTGVFYRLTGVFERGIGSTLPEGSISYLGYANQILVILATITTSGITTTIYPLLSKAWSEQNFEWLQSLVNKGINIIFLLSLPISVIFICWGEPIIQIMLERGAFTHEATIAVSAAFAIMVMAFIAGCLGNIVVKFFYFTHRTILLSCLEIISTLSYLLIAYFMVKTFSYKGLAVATSSAALISISMSFIAVSIFVREIKFGKTVKTFMAILFAAVFPAICILVGLKISGLSIENPFLQLVAYLPVYLGIYYLLLRIFKIEEVAFLHLKIQSLIKK